MLKYLLLIGSLSLSLVGCANLNPMPAPVMTNYTLSEIGSVAIAKTHTKKTLYIAPVLASPGYGGVDMIYTDQTYTIKHFTKNSWIAPPAQLITPLLVQSIQNTQYFNAVISGVSAINAEWQLDSQLLLLQQEFTGNTSQVHLVIRIQLFDIGQQRILATKQINIIEAAPTANPNGGAIAANHVVAKALAQISQFIVTIK